MNNKATADKTSIFVGVAFILIAGIIGIGGILWKNFVEYTSHGSDLTEVFDGIANRAPYDPTNDPDSRNETIFTFTIPRGDLVQFIEIMQPMLDQIVANTGKTARIDVSTNELEVITKLKRRLADFGSVTALAYITHRRSHPIKAVLERYFNPPKRAIFVVRKDDPADALEDLRGYRVAYRSGDALSGYMIPVRELASKGIAHNDFFKQETFADNYSDSILGLQNDQFDCIILTSNFFLEQPEEVRNSMKIIHESQVLPGGVYITGSTSRNPLEQTITGNFIKLGSKINPNAAFAGMFTTRQPDFEAFDRLEKEFVHEP